MSGDFSDPYTYIGTNVLGNKPGIRDEGALKQFEYEQSATRLAELREKPIAGSFDLAHLRAIHAHVFQDCYDWAGQLRVINISKGGTSFARAQFIEGQAERLSTSLAKDRHLQGLQKPQFVEHLAHYYAEWNAVHPFRDGNGRSTREFIGQLAREAGYELDQTRIDNSKDQWNEAAKRSFQGDLGPVREIFGHAVRPSRALAFEKLPAAEALARHPELQGAYDGLQAAGYAMAERFPDNPKAQSHFVDQARTEILRKLDTGQVIERADPQQRHALPEPPARAKAFQAVADNQLSRDDALKSYPELRPAFNQLVVAKLRHASEPQQVEALRGKLQAALNAGEIPAPTRESLQQAILLERAR